MPLCVVVDGYVCVLVGGYMLGFSECVHVQVACETVCVIH